MAVNFLVNPELCLRSEVVAVVKEAGDEGEVNTEELAGLCGLTASSPGSVKILLDCHHSTLAFLDQTSIDCSVVEIGEGSNLPGGNLLALINLHRVDDGLDSEHAGLVAGKVVGGGDGVLTAMESPLGRGGGHHAGTGQLGLPCWLVVTEDLLSGSHEDGRGAARPGGSRSRG